jgi:hypothetical protein
MEVTISSVDKSIVFVAAARAYFRNNNFNRLCLIMVYFLFYNATN